MFRSDTPPTEKEHLKARNPFQNTQSKKEWVKDMRDAYQELMMAAIRCHNKSHDSADAGHLFTEEEYVDVEQLILEIIRNQG